MPSKSLRTPTPPAHADHRRHWLDNTSAHAVLAITLCAAPLPGWGQSPGQSDTDPAQTPGNPTFALPPKAVTATPILIPIPLDRPADAPDRDAQTRRIANFGVLGEQDSMTVPFAIMRYSAQDIEDAQARTLADVLAWDANIRSGLTSGTFAENFTIRGFQLAAADASLNGLYGLAPRQIVSTDAVGHVDVFQGASAFLNGVAPNGTAIGGGIDVQLKQADDAPLARVTTAVTGSGQVGAHIDVGQRFGDDKQFGIRINESAADGNSAIDRQSGRNGTTAVSLDWRGEHLRLAADFLYQRERIDNGRSVYVDYGTSVPLVPAATSNYAQPWTYSNLEDTIGMLRAEYDVAPGWTVYAKGGVRHTDEQGNYASPLYYASTLIVDARLSVPYWQDARSAQVGLRGKFDTGPVSHQINVAASTVAETTGYAFTESNAYFTSLVAPVAVPYPVTLTGAGNLTDPNRTEEMVDKGLSISDTLGFFHDRALLTVGVRRQSISQQTYDYTGTVQQSNYQSSVTTPLLGIVYRVTSDLSLYANRSEALVPGSTAPIQAVNFGQVFAPYRASQFETGVKYDVGHYGANAALFRIELPSSFLDSTGYFTQAGQQRNQGAEINGYAELLRGLRIRGGASFTQATLVSTTPASDNGKTAIGVPKWLANLGLEYDVREIPGLTLSGNWTYTGAQYLDAANTMKIPHWNRFDIGARYATLIAHHAVTLRANLLNVANRAYWASAYDGYLTLGAPRTLLLSATTDF